MQSINSNNTDSKINLTTFHILKKQLLEVLEVEKEILSSWSFVYDTANTTALKRAQQQNLSKLNIKKLTWNRTVAGIFSSF